jgi:hypothetical protein
MIENIKEIFEICKELIVGFFGLVNDSIENDNLFDAFLMLLLGGMLFAAATILVYLIILAIINYPCLSFIFVIPFLPFIYIWWMKRRIKKKKEIDE